MSVVNPCGRNETHLPHQFVPGSHCPGIMPIFHCGVKVPHPAHGCETYMCDGGDTRVRIGPWYPSGLVWDGVGDR